jgi:UDP-N-acetylmuramoylalanine--D-glutamate ligase
MGRAGVGMAMALSKSGARVTVVDAKSGDSPEMVAALDRLGAFDVDTVTDWTGSLPTTDLEALAVSPGVPQDHPAVLAALSHGIPVWGEMEVAYRTTQSPIIAITGTNGKSTVTALTWHLLREAGASAWLCGNIAGAGLGEKPIGEICWKTGDSDWLVAEVSSFQLEWVHAFRPRAATITNITKDHLDRYATIEEYASMKHRIFMQMAGGDVAVLSRFHPETLPPYPIRCAMRWIGPSDQDDLTIREEEIVLAGESLLREQDLWLPARHNLENAAAALLLASAAGFELRSLAPHVLSFQGIANRMERVAEHSGLIFINNSMCTNPAALHSSLAACPKPIRLVAGGIAKAESWKEYRGISNQDVRRAYLYGRDAELLKQAFEADGVDCAVFTAMEDAVRAAYHDALEGDVILLSPACASFDQFSGFEERGERFRETVLSLGETER